MASVKILLYKHKTLKDNRHPVVMSIVKDRKRKIISLGYSSHENHWNFDKNIPTAKHPHATELKQVIKTKKLRAEKEIMRFDNIGKPYTLEDIAHSINERIKPGSFKNYTEKVINTLKMENRNKYAKSYQDTLNAVLKYTNEHDVDFKHITPKFCRDFESNLLIENKRINTIAVHLRNIRSIYNKAIKDNIIPQHFYPFSEIRIKTEKTQKRAVTKNIIAEIKQLKLKKGTRIALARDIFMFSFYNRGINFIDIFYLKEKDIIDSRIYYRRSKVKEPMNVKLVPEALKIIKRYSQKKDPEKYVFPMLRNSDEYHRYEATFRNIRKDLSRIGEMVNSPVPLTSYVARHSWATIAKRSGVSTAVISEGLGHSTEKITQVYLDSFEDNVLDKANELITDL